MAERSNNSSSSARPQYHHFIPRFLLRNFAVFKHPGKITPKTSRSKKKSPPVPNRLNLLNLETGKLEQADVGHTFGFVDMYRDFDVSEPNQYDLEKRLSRLESDASEIFRKAKRLHDAGKEEVQLSRKEKDLVRRFLFIMLYRNRNQASRYEKSAEDYDSNDREFMLAYMKEKGFKRPRDVWFANIRAFLDVDLSTEPQVWKKQIEQRAFPHDAQWFFNNIQMSFLAFCTPEADADEFILTQNAYSIFEGPNSAGAWTDYHIFAPVSPKLMLVTRSFLLPSGFEEDETNRKILLEAIKSMHGVPEMSGSCLEDLPVAKARNNYTKVVNGKFEPLHTNMSRDKHIFYFRFFPIKNLHVQKINAVFLEEALGTIAIVYKSPASLSRALEFYLPDESLRIKQMYRAPPTNVFEKDVWGKWSEDKAAPYLQLLERIAKELGATVVTKFTLIDPGSTSLGSGLGTVQTDVYEKLGGTASTLIYDFDQANRLAQLVIKSDSMTRMQSKDSRDVMRQNRVELISSLPPRRVWLFVKQLRDLSKRNPKTRQLLPGQTSSPEGVEDAFANAHNVFKPNHLSRMIYKVADLETFTTWHPDVGLVRSFRSLEEDGHHMMEEIAIVFDNPGSIRDCGIKAIEGAVRILATKPCPGRHAIDTNTVYGFLSDEQLQELWLRNGVEMTFDNVMKDVLGGSELQELKRVMFRHLYRVEFGGRVRG